MKFVSFNVQYRIGLDGKYDAGRIIAALDIIAMPEVSRSASLVARLSGGWVDELAPHRITSPSGWSGPNLRRDDTYCA